MDKIIKTEEELGEAIVHLKNGKSIKVKTNTINTYWESGRKDCTVQMLESLGSGSSVEKI